MSLSPHLRHVAAPCEAGVSPRVRLRSDTADPDVASVDDQRCNVFVATLARRAVARADPRKVGAEGVSRTSGPRRGGRAHGTGQGHRRRRAVRRRGRTPHAPGLLPARTAREDRHRRRLRHQQLRSLHGCAERAEREVVRGVRRPGRRRRGHHDRGSRPRRAAAPRPEGLPTSATPCSAGSARQE